MAQHRIVLIDDHPLFREGVRAMVAGHRDLLIVGEAGDVAKGLDIIDKQRPDAVLLDISLPGSDGMSLLRRIAHPKSPPRVLILSMHKSLDYVRQAMASGAAGYALKDDPPAVLLDAIRAILTGETYLSPQVKEAYEKAQEEGEQPGAIELLSEREREIFGLIVRGNSSQQIAASLFISIKTVETHRANINRKLGAHSTGDLVRLAAQRGLLPN